MDWSHSWANKIMNIYTLAQPNILLYIAFSRAFWVLIIFFSLLLSPLVSLLQLSISRKDKHRSAPSILPTQETSKWRLDVWVRYFTLLFKWQRTTVSGLFVLFVEFNDLQLLSPKTVSSTLTLRQFRSTCYHTQHTQSGKYMCFNCNLHLPHTLLELCSC